MIPTSRKRQLHAKQKAKTLPIDCESSPLAALPEVRHRNQCAISRQPSAYSGFCLFRDQRIRTARGDIGRPVGVLPSAQRAGNIDGMKREIANPDRYITAAALAGHDIFFMLSNS